MNGGRFYGKYRGIVTSIHDPLFLNRITANVPDVYGDVESSWALPCAPFGGDNMGFFALPAKGANVWIEFEHGDPDYPIWTGIFWTNVTQIPPKLLIPPYSKVELLTDGGHRIVLDDTPIVGGITLETSAGMKLVIDTTGITLDNGMGAKIEMNLKFVRINTDGLVVL